MRIIAIETSCDETAIALLEASGGLHNPKFKILENLVASQIKIHRPFGGVVPNLAKREHTKNLPILFRKIFGISNFQFLISNQFSIPQFSKLKKIDLIAVTVGPGLEPCLWTGIEFARDLYRELTTNNKQLTTKLLGVNHLEGHLYSFLLPQKRAIFKSEFLISKIFPAIALIVSGGHTALLLMKNLKNYKKLGETRDDAVGESFDKVARLLGLSYPGGPEIEKLAKKGDSEAINFPRPMISQKNYDFSFSGLKTAVLYYIRDSKLQIPANLRRMNKKFVDSDKFVASHRIADVAASFQKAAFDVLIYKTLRAAKEFKAKSIMVSGGVAANRTLRSAFKKAIADQRPTTNNQQHKNPITNYQLLITEFPTDNAVMIGAAGYINFLRKKNYKLEANGNLGL